MRLKIVAGNLVAVLVLGVASFLFLNSQLKAEIGASVDASVSNAQILFDRSWRLSGLEFAHHVEERALSREFVDVFAGLDESSRRTRANQAADRVAAWFGDSSRRGTPPDVVVVTDERGTVLARNADINRMFGEALVPVLPSLRSVLQTGSTRIDVWNKTDDAKLLQTAIAPIRGDQNNIIGALIVAYDISDGFVRREAETLGADVAVLVDGKVYSASLAADRRNALKSYLFDDERMKVSTAAAMAGSVGTPPTSWRATLGDHDYIGSVARLANADSSSVAYAVFADRTDALSAVSQTNVILYLTALAALIVLAYGFFLGGSILRPIEQIEETILAIINGRPDLRIELEHPEFGGLAYRINQLLNVFTGVQEDIADEQGRLSTPDDSMWHDQAFSDAGGAGAAGNAAEPIDDAALAAKLEAEPEADYFARVYRDFVRQKQALGENVTAMTQDKFSQRLKGTAEAHAKKHGVRLVRYQIETAGGQVHVRPVLIR